MKKTLFSPALFIFLTGLFFIFAQSIKAQSALDGFDPNPNGDVFVVVQADGKIIIGGYFTTVSPNGGAPVARNSIARFNPDGTLDAAFNPNPSDASTTYVFTLFIQPDGKILVGGTFSSIGGQARKNLARVDATTGLADSFNPNASHPVYAIAVQSDGKDIVYAIAVQSDSKVLAGGRFTSIGGQARSCIARLDSMTGLADSFNPNAYDDVTSIAVQPDGKILAGGFFSNIGGGYARNKFARLANDTAALSTLIINRTSITLARDGAAPQSWHVFFEQSTDNGLTYTPLGSAANSLMMPTGFSGGSILGSS